MTIRTHKNELMIFTTSKTMAMKLRKHIGKAKK